MKNIYLFSAATVVFLLILVPTSQAQVAEEPPHMPGIIEETGTHFEITDSAYLNITLDSSEIITARIESTPEMITLEAKASAENIHSHFILSGLAPDTQYHKYEDSYHNYKPLVSNEMGVAEFDQIIDQEHIVFIQPRKSTKFIRDNLTGGDCASIGSWAGASKTCTLNQDIHETIQIDSNDIILDGNNHAVIGTRTGNGIYIIGRNVTVKNITIKDFNYGIRPYINNLITNTNVIHNNCGIYVGGFGNTISNNVIGPENWIGVYEQHSRDNTYENNNILNNQIGVRLYSNYITLRGNSISGNTESNFYLSSYDMTKNNIDITNIVDGKSIYYVKNVTNETYDGSLNIGAFYCLNCDRVSLKNVSFPEKEAQIIFWHTNNSLVENIFSPDKTIWFSLLYSSNNVIRKNTLGSLEFYYDSNRNQIYNNNFMDARMPVYVSGSDDNIFNLDLPIGGNYWKKNRDWCKDLNGDKICDASFEDDMAIDHYPWTKEFDFSKPSCCSSVIFLPGHQASRLYKKDTYGEMKLWEPDNKNIDVEKLYLNPDGSSTDAGIYTRDIIDEGYGIKNIYKSFIKSMDQLVIDGIINEWKPIPYDWRLPLEKIVEDGVGLENGGHLDIIEEVKRMAASSRTGKLTIIGHSNGGLLSKALIDKLKESGNEKLIDDLIMVATPQLGTPKAMAALLHGDEANLLHGLTLDNKTGREFAENMSSAYNLLPSQKYFDTVQSPVVEFSSDVKNIYDFRLLYGESIDNWNEFKKFLLGDDGMRAKSEAGDLDSPNVLRETLLAEADAMHDKLDNWQAPEGMDVIQIAGWGLDTIRGIEYDDCDFLFCPDKLSNLDRLLLLAQDGDGTVIVPSAVNMDGNAERYYLNLNRYNRFVNLSVNREHANILEIEPFQNFIKNIIQGNKTLTDYISTEKPEVKEEDKRLRFRLHSPVALDLYDEDGKHTGFVKNNNPAARLYEEQIPNSYYTEFGETKYAGAGDSPVDIVLTGEDLGTFTFEIDQVIGDAVAQNTTFANIPVMRDMQAMVSASEAVSEMKIDVDGDGRIDATFQPGKEIRREDLLGIFEKIINSLDVEVTVKNRLVNKIDGAKKQMEKGHIISAAAMLENVKQQIRTFSREQTPEKFRIAKEEAEKLVRIIERIQAVE